MPDQSGGKGLTFRVVSSHSSMPADQAPCAYLVRDAWDDWGKYCTQFQLNIVDADGVAHRVGEVKVGSVGLKPHHGGRVIPEGARTPGLPAEFEALPSVFFSLGQSDDYYENLSQLGDAIRENVLRGLRDVAFDETLWARHIEEYVMGESLLRSVTPTMVEGQYRRMARGGVRLTCYKFFYSPPKRMGDGRPPFRLEFSVDPESLPPSNVHALIGRNGVGKTRLLDLMAKSLVAPDAQARQSGHFEWGTEAAFGARRRFANLVAVTFSAFDDVELLPETKAKDGGVKYSHIGLQRPSDDSESHGKTKSPGVLAREFVSSLANCQNGARERRWLDAMTVLDSDPVFRAAGIRQLLSQNLTSISGKDGVQKVFSRLSSGHKIVLLSITRLVEVVEEKSLVLLDEPEAHLHPPLLSAFVRALSKLLIDRNGVAIIATHSPVVLQEVPKRCAWILSRSLAEAKAERPSIETFGENVGILSREVFQLELSQAGFQKLLEDAVRKHSTYEDAVSEFGGQLGAEARAVLRALYLDGGPQAHGGNHA